jgi:hypothetical protein
MAAVNLPIVSVGSFTLPTPPQESLYSTPGTAAWRIKFGFFHERELGEGGEKVELEAEQLREIVVGDPAVPFRVGDDDLRHPLRVERGQRGDEGGVLLALDHPVDHLAPVGAQHASPVGHGNAGDLPRHRVDDA